MISLWIALLDIWATHSKYKSSPLLTLGWPILQGEQPIASNKSWSIISQGMFALRKINQMECKMCSYLKWQLNIDPSQLWDFESKIWQDSPIISFEARGSIAKSWTVGISITLSYLIEMQRTLCCLWCLLLQRKATSRPLSLLRRLTKLRQCMS